MTVTGRYVSRGTCRNWVDLPDSAACCVHACSLFLSNQLLSLLHIIGDPLASHLWAPPSPPPRKCDKSLTKQRKINWDRCHCRPPCRFHVRAEDLTTAPHTVAGGRPKTDLMLRLESSLCSRGRGGSIKIHMHPATGTPQVILQAAQPSLPQKSSAWHSRSTSGFYHTSDFLKIQHITQMDF